MQYVSTRGNAPAIGFLEAALGGLAPDGGLYVPQAWPQIPMAATQLGGLPYAHAAAGVLRAFAGDALTQAEAEMLCVEAYASFAAPDVTPLRQIGDNSYILELFHGPTLAFKDVALQLIGKLFDWALTRSGERRTVIAATSGDTGGAAAGALAGLKAVDLFVMFPAGRISEVQRRFMTTTGEANIHAIEIEGSFDDAQAIMKQMLADQALVQQAQLSAVNSVNWLRIAAQSVYYFTTAARLGKAPIYAVPTGNFGDAFAGYVARALGSPTAHFVIATNSNDILARTLDSGRYAQGKSVATSSPAMDITLASNFERLLFDASGRDSKFVADAYARLSREGGYDIPAATLNTIRASFSSGSANDAEVAAKIQQMHKDSGFLVDPHTAVGLVVADKLSQKLESIAPGAPIVTLSTAHAAKFPETVSEVTGVNPALPAHCADLFSRKENIVSLPADANAIKAYLLGAARAAR
ncbi:MAG: threonine synthase [Caulobacterales bacterium]